MLLGPVFRAELLRTSRRRRYYAIRSIYGLGLLGIVWLAYSATFVGRSSTTIAEAAQFAEETFTAFAICQVAAVLLMIPALFGGAIADEKQRKTLHYLMASELSSFEIVVDKVLGRAPHVATTIALGLPIVCLMGLIGGIPPGHVAIAYVGTASTATMAAALTVLVSTLSRKVRQAVLVSYVLLLAWQLAPAIILGAGSRLLPREYAWVEPVNTSVGWTSPLWVWVHGIFRTGFGRRGPLSAPILLEGFAWMVGLQLASAVAMILLAVWRLRPAFRRHEATQPWRNWFGSRRAGRSARGRPRAWWGRPPCGDDAMLWKERHFARSDVFTKLVVLPAVIFTSTVLILSTGLDESLTGAVARLWRGGGLGADVVVDQLRVASAWYVAIWLLALAGSSASCLTVEREEDTWVSLTSTPLTGPEIIRGKVLGAAWAQRGFLAIPLGLWTVAMLAGALHPLAFLAALGTLGLVSWLVVAVGVHASLVASSTSRALAGTIATLAVLSGYPLFLFASFLDSTIWRLYVAFVGFPARIAVGPLATPERTSRVLSTAWHGHWAQIPDLGNLGLGLALSSIYLLIAAVLTNRAVVRFDDRLDRPSLVREASPTKPVPPVEAGPSLA